MSHTEVKQSRWQAVIRILAMSISLALVVIVVKAAHQVQRPIPDGNINQTYLWANETLIGQQVNYHKGVDFPIDSGTDTFSIAAGTVVDIRESLADDDHTTNLGNFILIRHSAIQRHWDQPPGDEGEVSYTYSMYLHLSYDSILPGIGDTVSAGELIAQSGNTGNSTGPHLHLQIVLHPDEDVSLMPDALQSGTNSRNPELWLKPLPGTATAIGKVSDTNGDPVQNLVVCGLAKDPALGYTSLRTYSFSWANPDDILRENFGTTDVRPGTYSLYAANRATGCGGAVAYNLGNHTFAAGRITYIGLYPTWLPLVKPAVNSWDAEMFIRNHDSAGRSDSYTTYTYHASYIYSGQRNRISLRQGTSVVADEPSKSFAGIVVPNRDSSVLLISRYNGQPAGYSGITAGNGLGSAGWERGGTTLFVPLVKDRWVNRSSDIYVTNIGAGDTRINVTYYSQAGDDYQGPQNLLVRPNQRTQLNSLAYVPNNAYYSAKITNSPVIASRWLLSSWKIHQAPRHMNGPRRTMRSAAETPFFTRHWSRRIMWEARPALRFRIPARPSLIFKPFTTT